MCSYDQSLVTIAFLREKLSQLLIRKATFFEGWSWFKFNNLGLAPGTSLKFYTSVAKGLKLKVRKSSGLIPTFVEVTEEKLVVSIIVITGKVTTVSPVILIMIKMLIMIMKMKVGIESIFRIFKF